MLFLSLAVDSFALHVYIYLQIIVYRFWKPLTDTQVHIQDAVMLFLPNYA